MNNDYVRHVRRAWRDTHRKSIRTDPEIYLPGEVDADTEDDDSDYSEDEVDADRTDELRNTSAGVKRKSITRSGNLYRAKVAKTRSRDALSTAALTVIDDRRPDLTLIDAPVGENIPSHPYGRHSCLFMEVKVDASKKPNPLEIVCSLFLGDS
jgi:hypothetical protein